ncbi:MAG TPA: cytochrome C oxidase subunit IV family protein [Candidatus Dormibacteraeota bacterium]|nr:cytochrome C oxidase subunit IV family protein [Candidatus Dormibacteraeota bacterium]
MKQTNPSDVTFRSYAIGFVLSIALTVEAYVIALNHLAGSAGWALVLALVGLALTQMVIQLIFFLGLGRGPRPKLDLIVFFFMIVVVSILVLGSLWIMYNLNYRMTSPSQINNYLHLQDGI